MTRHRWGEKVRFPNKTEQQCIQCGLVKVGRHEVEGGRDRYWTEFWRGLDRVTCEATPPCRPVTSSGDLVTQAEAR